MADLTVSVDGRELAAEWTDENPAVSDALADALPAAGNATRWGDELYFSVSLDASPASTRTEVPEGAVAYWPAGDVLCLFWGPTPASVDDEPRAAEDVAVVAEVADVSPLEDLDGGATVRVEER
ncbi:cyclophilin-like fold protein [Halomicrobium urmianum]|uniref:cyclophilin-like fold protein n=1 Tax=Halomicrobium urmianum TaxID=1586233 RepID=UPI001CD9258E|nr:cyclophilin-like family protein [Halomicrobium urmianum]